jgi:hypothetical protein
VGTFVLLLRQLKVSALLAAAFVVFGLIVCQFGVVRSPGAANVRRLPQRRVPDIHVRVTLVDHRECSSILHCSEETGVLDFTILILILICWTNKFR